MLSADIVPFQACKSLSTLTTKYSAAQFDKFFSHIASPIDVMALSGVKPEEGLVALYQKDFKLGRKHKYLILEINDEVITVKEKGSANATEHDFVAALSKIPDFCYGVFSGPKKIGFLIYGPPTADFKKGMIYASTAPALLQSLDGAYDCRKADDASDILDLLNNANII